MVVAESQDRLWRVSVGQGNLKNMGIVEWKRKDKKQKRPAHAVTGRITTVFGGDPFLICPPSFFIYFYSYSYAYFMGFVLFYSLFLFFFLFFSNFFF